MPEKHVIRIGDITGKQQDKIARIMRDAHVGEVTALYYVMLKDDIPGLTLSDAMNLTSRDVRVISVDEEDREEESAREYTQREAGPDPTSGPG